MTDAKLQITYNDSRGVFQYFIDGVLICENEDYKILVEMMELYRRNECLEGCEK